MNDHSFEKPGEEEDDGPEYIGQQYLLQAAREIRRRITPAMIAGFERWRDASGVRSA
jgi:AAA family ATPase